MQELPQWRQIGMPFYSSDSYAASRSRRPMSTVYGSSQVLRQFQGNAQQYPVAQNAQQSVPLLFAEAGQALTYHLSFGHHFNVTYYSGQKEKERQQTGPPSCLSFF